MSDRDYLNSADSIQEDSCNDTIDNEHCVSNTSSNTFKEEIIPVAKMENPLVPTCLTESSLPKNWTQVRKLKEQRQLLHQQLFAKKLDVTKTSENESYKKIEARFDDKSDLSASDSSDDGNLVIVESDTSGANDSSNEKEKSTELSIDSKQIKESSVNDNSMSTEMTLKDRLALHHDDIPYSSEDSDIENHDCSDLCLLTPSKINDALHVAIASVNDDVCKKQKKKRIKEVLNKLKMKAEYSVTSAYPGSAAYTISKPLNSLPISTCGCSFNQSNGILPQNVNVTTSRDITQPSFHDQVKYVGLPFHECLSRPKMHTGFTGSGQNNPELLGQNLSLNIEISGDIPTAVGDGRANKGDEDSFDYTNIAFQKLMAERRLKTSNKTNDKSLVENKKDDTSDKCSQGLKLIRRESLSGTTIVEFKDTFKDANNLDDANKLEECNIRSIGLFDRMKEIRLANQMMLKAQHVVAKEKKHLHELKRECLEMGGDDVSPSLSPLSSSPVYINVEYHDDVSSENTFHLDSRQRGTKRKISMLDRTLSKDSSKQGSETCYDKHPSNKNKVEKENLSNSYKQSDELENSQLAVSPRMFRKRVGNKRPSDAKSRKIMLEKNVIYRSEAVNKTPNSVAKTAGNTCIVSSQSLLKKHLCQKDKFPDLAQVSASKCYAAAPQLSISAPISNLGNTADRDILASGNETLSNVPLGKVHPPILHHTLPVEITKSTDSRFIRIPTFVSHNNNINDPSKTVIMPIGCVKDEGTNQVYPTYQYNGFTFALINNKMYHIRMNSPSCYQGTTVGARLSLGMPNALSAPVILPSKPNQVPILDPNVKRSLINIKPRFEVKDSMHTSLRDSVHLVGSGHSVPYRFPVNLISSSSASQTVNLAIAPKTGNSVSETLQVQPGQGMVLSGGNHSNVIVTAPGNRAVAPKVQMQSQSIPISKLTSLVSKGAASTVQPVFRQANQQICSANSTAVQSRSCDKTLVKVTSSDQLCKVRPGKTKEVTLKLDKSQKEHINEAHNCKILESCEKRTSGSQNRCPSDFDSLNINIANAQKSLRSEFQTIANDIKNSSQNEQVSRKRKRRCKLVEGDESLVTAQSSSNGRSIESSVMKHKRKRKGTPAKKISRQESTCDVNTSESQTEEPKLLLREWLEEQEESRQKSMNNKEDMINNERVETPIPFVNYPARIVSKHDNKDGSKTVSIIGTPNSQKDRHGCSDTSLDEEKMAKMIQFADEFEMELKKKAGVGTSVKKGLKFKKRKYIDSRQFPTSENLASVSTNIKTEIPTKIALENEEVVKDKENSSDMIEMENAESPCAVLENKPPQPSQAKQHTSSRNIFDAMEVTGIKQCENSDKDTEVEDQYDSSDLESYEQFLVNKVKNSIKRKSQLIESYYTAEGLRERNPSNHNTIPMQSFDKTDASFTSKVFDKLRVTPVVREKEVQKGSDLNDPIENQCSVINHSKVILHANEPNVVCDSVCETSSSNAEKTIDSIHKIKMEKDVEEVEDQAGTGCVSCPKDMLEKTVPSDHEKRLDVTNCNNLANEHFRFDETIKHDSQTDKYCRADDVFNRRNSCPCYTEKMFTKTKLVILKGKSIE